VSASNSIGGTGVYGSTSNTFGVHGDSSNGGSGVYGTSTGAGGVGVYGIGDTYGVEGGGLNGDGVYGTTRGTGVVAGIHGVAFGAGGNGVIGRCDNGAGAFGVWGISNTGSGVVADGGPTGVSGTGSSYGVYGDSSSGYGVYGTTNSPAGGNAAVAGVNSGAGPGVVGAATSSAGGSPAIQGVNFGLGGPGVVGFSGSGTGVGGGTGDGIGFGGIASGAGRGVVGQAGSGSAVQGISTGSGLAGDFRGSVQITGGLTVMGQNYKSAAVRGPSGSLVRLYCIESPESWFEDFGSAQLSNGVATVQLEPGFAGVVKTDAYHVFLTPQGESKGWLYVSQKTPSGFTVHEAGGGSSTVVFDYRVVAKRKDIEGARLEHVDEPVAVQLIKLPEVPATLPAPTPPGHGR
jgi:hypothetical protein